jgi:hypothetical protein
MRKAIEFTGIRESISKCSSEPHAEKAKILFYGEESGSDNGFG